MPAIASRSRGMSPSGVEKCEAVGTATPLNATRCDGPASTTREIEPREAATSA